MGLRPSGDLKGKEREGWTRAEPPDQGIPGVPLTVTAFIAILPYSVQSSRAFMYPIA